MYLYKQLENNNISEALSTENGDNVIEKICVEFS